MRFMASDMARLPVTDHAIPFTLGARRLFTAERKLARLSYSLEDALNGQIRPPPALSDQSEGLRILSAPLSQRAAIRAQYPDLIVGDEIRFARHYIAMSGGFDDYMAQFSGKTRSTLRRKVRKFSDTAGGALDLRSYRTADEVRCFFSLAIPLAQRTYQTRLLDAGLPSDDRFVEETLALAARDKLRTFLLFLDDTPVAYLYLPVAGQTLIYAFLGYDPDHASLSPGTVLQLAALEQLFAEGQFRYFDFTEGDGAHKARFGTDMVECVSFLLLRPSLSNRLLLMALLGFDGAVAAAKALARQTGAEAKLRQLTRT